MQWALFGGLLLVGSLAVVVVITVGRRGRSSFAWFPLSAFFSPDRAAPRLSSLNWEDSPPYLFSLTPEPLLPPVAQFEPEGFYGDVPYKVNELGSVDAILAGRVLRFPDADLFLEVAHFACGSPEQIATSRSAVPDPQFHALRRTETEPHGVTTQMSQSLC
jgi:hypothetical protein